MIRDTTVEQFRADVGGTEPVPAGVSISSVAAGLALALLAKVLDIASRRKDAEENRARIEALVEACRAESKNLTELADQDVLAFNGYLECVRAANGDKHDAMCKCIEVPMEGGRAVLRGLDLCVEGIEFARGLTVADLAIAADLMLGAIRGMLVSVDFNLKLVDPASDFAQRTLNERREMELRAVRLDDLITTAVRRLLL